MSIIYSTNSDFDNISLPEIDAADLIIPISFYANVNQSIPFSYKGVVASSVETWGKIVKVFTEKLAPTIYHEKTDAFLYSPTIYGSPTDTREVLATRGIRRGEYATESETALLVVDADHGMQFDFACDRLRENGIEALIHTTASNIHDDKFRILVPLRQPITIGLQRAAVRAFCRFVEPNWVPDLSKLNAISLFYVPGTYQVVVHEDGETTPCVNRLQYLSGKVLTAEQWMDLFPAPLEPVSDYIARLPKIDYTVDDDIPLTIHDRWHIENCPAVAEYQNLPKGMHHTGLYSMAYKIACSAYNAGYDLDVATLADFTWDVQVQTLGHESAQKSNKRWSVEKFCAEAISSARVHVSDPYFRRRKKKWYDTMPGIQSGEEMREEAIRELEIRKIERLNNPNENDDDGAQTQASEGRRPEAEANNDAFSANKQWLRNFNKRNIR